MVATYDQSSVTYDGAPVTYDGDLPATGGGSALDLTRPVDTDDDLLLIYVALHGWWS